MHTTPFNTCVHVYMYVHVRNHVYMVRMHIYISQYSFMLPLHYKFNVDPLTYYMAQIMTPSFPNLLACSPHRSSLISWQICCAVSYRPTERHRTSPLTRMPTSSQHLHATMSQEKIKRRPSTLPHFS